MNKQRWAILVVAGLLALTATHATAEETTITLEPELSSTTAKMITPSRMLPDRNKQSVTGAGPTVTIAGKTVLVAVNDKYVGMDTNDDGSISQKERVVLKNGEGAFKVCLGEDDSGKKIYMGVIIKDLTIRRSSQYDFRLAPASCLKGLYNGETIRVFDDNLDGQFTTDGSDAIAIGRSAKGAVPLVGRHLIGKTICDITIAEDGASLTITPVADVPTGKVKVPIKSSVLGVMVVSDGKQAYDLVSADAIPAGSYRLVYGAIATGRNISPMIPSAMSLTYEIRADVINTVQVGGPLWIHFNVSASGGAFKVFANGMKIYGIGGEEYVADFDSGGNATKPTVKVIVNGRTSSSQAMSYG